MSNDYDPTEKLLQAQVKLRAMIADCEAGNDKFVEGFRSHPAYALEWADSTFKNTARLRVFTELCQMITGILDGQSKRASAFGDGYQYFVDWVKKTALDRCAHLAQSTSVSCNYLSALESATWAHVARNDFNVYY